MGDQEQSPAVKLQSIVYLVWFLRATKNQKITVARGRKEHGLLELSGSKASSVGESQVTLGTSRAGCLRCLHREASAWGVKSVQK